MPINEKDKQYNYTTGLAKYLLDEAAPGGYVQNKTALTDNEIKHLIAAQTATEVTKQLTNMSDANTTILNNMQDQLDDFALSISETNTDITNLDGMLTEIKADLNANAPIADWAVDELEEPNNPRRILNKPELFSGDYNDLINKPEIQTITISQYNINNTSFDFHGPTIGIINNDIGPVNLKVPLISITQEQDEEDGWINIATINIEGQEDIPLYIPTIEYISNGDNVVIDEQQYTAQNGLLLFNINGQNLYMPNYNTIQSNLTLSDIAISGNYSDLTNIPNISTVGTTGNYSDLLYAPSAYTFDLTEIIANFTSQQLIEFTANRSVILTANNLQIPQNKNQDNDYLNYLKIFDNTILINHYISNLTWEDIAPVSASDIYYSDYYYYRKQYNIYNFYSNEQWQQDLLDQIIFEYNGIDDIYINTLDTVYNENKTYYIATENYNKWEYDEDSWNILKQNNQLYVETCIGQYGFYVDYIDNLLITENLLSSSISFDMYKLLVYKDIDIANNIQTLYIQRFTT